MHSHGRFLVIFFAHVRSTLFCTFFCKLTVYWCCDFSAIGDDEYAAQQWWYGDV